jgi:hypothetical protein
MTYTKPEILLLGSASIAVAGQDCDGDLSKGGISGEGCGDVSTVGAYSVDE